jgi:2-C-methyl-D-erythritol 4-phosphate cytidylyltransferase
VEEPGFPSEIAVIIPAAGSGSRLGGHRKQFRELGGKPVIVQTLLVFERHPAIQHIVVAAPETAVKALQQEFKRVGISKLERVVAGGSTRQESVRAAVEALPPLVDLVMVHDAVRPFVRLSQITRVLDAARQAGAAAPAIPVSDTVRRSLNGFFAETVDREGLLRMQTPQAFGRAVLARAHELADEEGYEATDEVGLVQRSGVAVRWVEGSNDNVKITTPDDWDRALEFWPMWEKVLRLEGDARDVVSGIGS